MNYVLWIVVGLLALEAPLKADTLQFSGGAGGSYALNINSLKQSKFKATLKQQYDFSCGSAALATLLTYHYGTPVTEQVIFEEMFARGDKEKIREEGFSLFDMKSYLTLHGFEADGFELPLSKLEETGLPAIALVTEKGYHHFVVVKGLREGRVLIGDPSNGTRSIPSADFESAWANKILFVIHNKQSMARFNQASDWQAAPRSPLAMAADSIGSGGAAFGKFGPSDY